MENESSKTWAGWEALPNVKHAIREFTQATTAVVSHTIEDNGARLRRSKELAEAKRAAAIPELNFRYSALQLPSTTCIRLLTIHPGSQSEVIQCSLRVVDLNQSPTYTALSYTWAEEKSVMTGIWYKVTQAFKAVAGSYRSKEQDQGVGSTVPTDETLGKHTVNSEKDQGPSHVIICNGKLMKVYPALYRALLQFREDRPGTEIWTDSLCINQGDNEEKSWQVQMMGRIYESADSVLVWLGPVPAYLAPGFARLESIINHELSKPEATQSKFDAIEWNMTSLRQSEGEDKLPLFALLHLISRGYFRRIWVLQEIALAHNVTFSLGMHQFGPNFLSKVLGIIDSPTVMATPGTKPSSDRMVESLKFMVPWWVEQINSMPFPGMERTTNVLKARDSTLQDWLQACIGRGCQVRADLIFAGLALIRPDLLKIRQDLLIDEPSPPPLPPRPAPPGTDPDSEWDDPSPPPLPPRPVPSGSPRGDVEINEFHQPLLPPRPVKPTRVGSESTSVCQSDAVVRLWTELHVDYSVPEQEVLLNLAACVLSGPDGMRLLSISSRLRDWYGWNLLDTPTWIPALDDQPWHEGKVISLDDTFSAATKLKNDPKISRDGRTLTLDACRIGRLQYSSKPIGVDHPKEVSDVEIATDFLTALQKLAEKDHVGASSLTALVNASTYGSKRNDPMRLQELTEGFCFLLHAFVCWTKSSLDRKKPMIHAESLASSMWQKVSLKSERSRPSQESDQGLERLERVKKGLLSVYADLRASYPEAPWSDAPISYFITMEKFPVAALKYASRIGILSRRRVFITENGYIGGSAAKICNGDEVMLIKGAHVPYVFRRLDDALRQSIQSIEEEREKFKFMLKNRERTNNQIQSLKDQIGKKDGWVLIGEAYVEGIMDGEAIAEYMDRFERITIF